MVRQYPSMRPIPRQFFAVSASCRYRTRRASSSAVTPTAGTHENPARPEKVSVTVARDQAARDRGERRLGTNTISAYRRRQKASIR